MAVSLYSVTAKLIKGTVQDIESKVSNYINSIPTTKVIRSITMTVHGGEAVYVLIVHDA